MVDVTEDHVLFIKVDIQGEFFLEVLQRIKFIFKLRVRSRSLANCVC